MPSRGMMRVKRRAVIAGLASLLLVPSTADAALVYFPQDPEGCEPDCGWGIGIVVSPSEATDGPPEGQYIDLVTNVVYGYDAHGTLVPIGISAPQMGYVTVDVSARGQPLPDRLTGACANDICVSWVVSVVGSYDVEVKLTLTDCSGGEVAYSPESKPTDQGAVTSTGGMRGYAIPSSLCDVGLVTARIELRDPRTGLWREVARDDTCYARDGAPTPGERVAETLRRADVAGVLS